MKRAALALSLILTMLFSVVVTTGNVKVTSAASENWVEVVRYSGEGHIGLYPREKFAVSHSEWRAKWHIVKEDIGNNLFILQLSLSRYESVGTVTREFSDPTSGTIVVHNQNRTFFIQVDLVSVKSWEVIIEENVNSPLLDITDPIVTIISPENKTYYTDNVALTYAVNEPNSDMWYQIGDSSWSSINQNRTLAELAAGSYSVKIQAKDEAGNIGFSKTVYFSVEKSSTALILAALITVAVVGVGLLFLLREVKKNRG
jgi:hypothetical protein